MAALIPLLRKQAALAVVSSPISTVTTGTTYRVQRKTADDVTDALQMFAVLYSMVTNSTSGNCTVKVQGSPDNSTWYDLGDATVVPSTTVAAELSWDQNFLPVYIRAYISTAGTLYSGSVYLASNGDFSLKAVT